VQSRQAPAASVARYAADFVAHAATSQRRASSRPLFLESTRGFDESNPYGTRALNMRARFTSAGIAK